ncbi:MAG: sodium:proton antiporter [Candidatus Nomurabacteria bacterium]|nr:MAG: sodium:proton antiporter [Candidatus Nomurabacteria bacterium]
MLTAEAALAIFAMFGISSLAIFWAKRFRIPHTVFLVIVGLIIGLISHFSFFEFFTEFEFTPELLFFLLLPTLIFESAYNINIRRIVDDAGIIVLLAVVGLLISTLIIGTSIYYLLLLLGLHAPFIVTLLFGALISATDPVAVLALFKEFGAPRRLSLIFEGESLFNDATAVALFLVLLGIASSGFHGGETILEGTVSFTSMMIGGVFFGVLMGLIFTKLIGYAKENEVASITLTIVLAHTTFILAEILSHYLSFMGFELPLSPIIATTIASLVMGNYGRSKIHPKAEEFVEKLWGQLAFLANSLIFILIGMLAVPVLHLDLNMMTVVAATIVVVAVARAISIYPTVGLYNQLIPEERKVPTSWQHLLSWGSLRGALAVTMVLMIPDNLSVAGWNLNMTPKEFLLSLTVGCIFATLFIKATTMQRIMNRLKLDQLTDIEQVEIQEARALIHHEVNDRIAVYQNRGYIEDKVANELTRQHQKQYDEACQELCSPDTKELSTRALRMYAIGIEKKYLKELYHHNEVNERVYRRLTGKLQLQLEAIESGNLAPDMTLHTDKRDVFDRLEGFFYKLIGKNTEEQTVDELYMYYRAQAIISRKALKELTAIDKPSAEHIFTKEALAHVVKLYTTFKENSEQKMEATATKHTERYEKLAFELATHGVEKIQENVLHELYERGLITPKLFITLSEEMGENKQS